MDARGVKGAWESLVYYVHPEKTAAVQAIADHAQWFEDRMPWHPQWRKPQVTGVSARAIEVIVEAGDSGPVTPIGINLPNDQDIRETYGSKSVSLSNVAEAYEKSTPREFRSEFSWNADEVLRAERWGAFASELTTNLHEIIGHGSGLVSPRLNGAPEKALKEHFSAIEEARADLVALYFVADPYLVEIGVVRDDRAQKSSSPNTRPMRVTRWCSCGGFAKGRRSKKTTCATASSSSTGCSPIPKQSQIARRDGKTYLPHGGCDRLPRGCGPPPCRGAAHSRRRRLCRGERAARDLRRALRSRPARRGRRPGRAAGSAVLHRVRDAEAGARHRCRRAPSST